jgi:hypothetical protein
MSSNPAWPGTYRPFSDYSLQRAVDRAVANLPADHTVAAVAHVDNVEGASLSLVVKVGSEWKLAATVVKDYNKPFKYGAEVVWSH